MCEVFSQSSLIVRTIFRQVYSRMRPCIYVYVYMYMYMCIYFVLYKTHIQHVIVKLKLILRHHVNIIYWIDNIKAHLYYL